MIFQMFTRRSTTKLPTRVLTPLLAFHQPILISEQTDLFQPTCGKLAIEKASLLGMSTA
jgi:hypothetical protein